MCGCNKHLKRRAKCTCVCPEHANFQAAYDLAMRRFDVIRDLEKQLDRALTAQPAISATVSAETVWRIADGLRKRFAVSNGTQVWVEYQGSAEHLADAIKDILDAAAGLTVAGETQ